jgi:hypothetical protein
MSDYNRIKFTDRCINFTCLFIVMDSRYGASPLAAAADAMWQARSDATAMTGKAMWGLSAAG